MAATAFTAASAASAVTARVAFADETWCDTDPVQLVITNGGNIVPVFVTNGARSPLYLPQLVLARITHTVKSVENGRTTLVTVSVTVPNDLLGRTFATRSIVSSGPLGLLKVYATTTGTSGSPMTMQFKLDVA